MERMTKHVKNEKDDYACIQECEKVCVHGWLKGEEGCRCEKFGELLVRLCQIEDILGDDYDLGKFRELVQADKEGRCVVLPVKPGEYIYLITLDREIIKCRVGSIAAEEWGMSFECAVEGFGTYRTGTNEKVFFTRESAEAALTKEAHHE